MHKSLRFVLGLLLVIACGMCAGERKFGLEIEGSGPDGTVESRKVKFIFALFNQPMVRPDIVGETVKVQATAPMAITPAVRGTYCWTAENELTFVPAVPLSRSTRYRITVPAGTRALDGVELEKPYEWSITTDRLDAQLSLTSDPQRPSPDRWATANQAVTVSLSQPATSRAVRSACSYVAGDETVAAVESNGDTSEPHDRFLLSPASPLALATKWRFRCSDSLVGVDGPLGMLHDTELAFETYGPLRVASVGPSGTDVDLDKAEVRIELSNPLGKGIKPLPFSIQPSVRGFPDRLSVDGASYGMTVSALEPNTEYTIRVPGQAVDAFGQTMEVPFESKFRTGDAKPRMDVETGSWVVEAARGSYPIWVRNISKIEATAAQVPAERVAALLPELDWWDNRPADLKSALIRAQNKTLAVPQAHNRWQQYALNPLDVFGNSANKTGFFYFALNTPDVPKTDGATGAREVFINLTNLGLTSKVASESGLVWVTALDSGAPVPDAEVRALSRSGRTLWKGTTDADGIAQVPGEDALMRLAEPKQEKAKTVERASEEDLEEERDLDHSGTSPIIFVARLGDDKTFVNPLFAGGFAKSYFNLHGLYADVTPTRGYLHSDRGLYRPGDTAHLKGLVRVMQPGKGLRLPQSSKVKVLVRDPRYVEVLNRECELGRFGGFSLDVPLSDDARLGDYFVSATFDGGQIGERFSVEEYRPNDFEVKASPDSPRYLSGQIARVKADGRYFYGSPMRGAKVKWTVHTVPRTVSSGKMEGYDFSDDEYRDHWAVHDSEQLLREDEQTLNAEGSATLAIDLVPESFKHRTDLRVTASVEDETHQSVAHSLVIPVHSSDRYFGIGLDDRLVEAQKPTSVRAIAVDLDGKQVAAKAKLTIKRVDWHCAYETWGYRGSYRCDKVEQEIETRDIVLNAMEPAKIPFVLPRGGEYEVRLDGSDSVGRNVGVRTKIWTSGSDDTSWRMDDTHRFEIVADKDSYRPGDTAHLVLKTPVAKGTVALVTLERDSVLEHKRIELDPGRSVVDIPLGEAHVPNVYVSVLLVTGRSVPGPRGLPSMRMGMVNLPVRADGKELRVTVTSDRPEYRPGDTVTATLEVKDATGAPVHAELALAAADEGVLSLIDFKTPNPIGAFYAPWGLGVTTATQYDRLAQLPEPGTERDATGGDGSGTPGSIRSQFRATAYWNPSVETDDAGRAVVHFTAPDNLTAYRLMAVAADLGDRFGSGEQRFTVRKPLQLLSDAPRFLSVGDEADVGALLINETGSAGTATVDISGQGITAKWPTNMTVSVPQGGRTPVVVRVKATASGEAKFRITASLAGERDGLEIKMPILYPGPFETDVLGEGTVDGTGDIALKLPDGTVPATATISMSVDPDGLVGMDQGLRQLIQYPYGCLEQTTSRLIPLLMVEELSKSLGLPELDGANLQRFIEAGISKIGRHQTEEGGFSLWPNGTAGTYLTAYALWGLKNAADAGHSVEAKRVEEGLSYLRRSLQGTPISDYLHNELGELGGRAFGLHVLALYGKPDPGTAAKLLEQKDSLPRFGLAFLARALASSLGPRDPAVSALVDSLTGAAKEDGYRAKIPERNPEGLAYYMSSDVRTTAIVADMLLDLRPEHPLLPRLVAELIADRMQGPYGGGWRNTQESLFALVALARYAKSRSGAAPQVEMSLGGTSLPSIDLSQPGHRLHHVNIPLPEGRTNLPPIHLATHGGVAHYVVQLRAQRDGAHQTAESHGFSVLREYLDPRTDAPIGTVKAGDTVRVRVKLHSDDSRYHVAVTDYLPAGLEAVQARFATSVADPNPKGGSTDEWDWWMTHKELHDNRVEVFSEYFNSGYHDFSYLARATTVGHFLAAGPRVEQMYEPEVHATAPPEQFEVRAP